MVNNGEGEKNGRFAAGDMRETPPFTGLSA